MQGKRCFTILSIAALVVCVCLFRYPAVLQAEPKTTTRDLESLVETIEDPEKRKALVDQLSALIEAQKSTKVDRPGRDTLAAEAGGAELSEVIFSRFESYLTLIAASARETGEVLSNTPAALKQAGTYLSRPHNREGLLHLLAVALGGFIVSLITRLVIRRRTPEPPSADAPWTRRAAASAGTGILRVLPAGFALAALFLIFRAVPCPAVGRALVFQLFFALFGYRVVMEGVRVLLSPDEPGLRTLSVKDESAYYYWVWLRRFADYALVYFLAVGTLALVSFPQTPLQFIRGLLLLVFPCLVTAFVLQVAKDLRAKPQEAPPSEAPATRHPNIKWIRTAVKLLPVLAIGYAWAFFLVLIASGERGFDFIREATLGTAVTIPAVIAALHLLDRLFNKLFEVHEQIKQRVPGIEERADRYLAVVRKVSSAVIVIIGAGVIAEFWGVPVGSFVVSKVGSTILIRSVTIAITLGIVIVVLQVSRILSVYLLRETERRTVTQKTRTLVPILRTTFNITAVFVGGIVILDRIGVDTTPILAGAGILGLAVGFGSQTLVKDLINGLFILFEESIRVGDWAQVGSKDGEVESVGLRTVRLRDLKGNVHVIPNSSIDTLTNFSKEFSRSVMDIGVAYREDIDEVITILEELGEELRNDPLFGPSILGPLEVFGLDRFEDSAVIVRISFNTRPMKQWGIKREYYRRMKRVFDERGVKIPFPHRTLYMGESKEGTSPPVYVRVEEQAGGTGGDDQQPALPTSETPVDPDKA